MLDNINIWSPSLIFQLAVPWIVVYLIAWIIDLREKVQKKK